MQGRTPNEEKEEITIELEVTIALNHLIPEIFVGFQYLIANKNSKSYMIATCRKGYKIIEEDSVV